MTSNIGSKDIVDFDGGDYEAMRERVMNELRGMFRPEFSTAWTTWWSSIVWTLGTSWNIVTLQLRDFKARLAAQRIGLEVSDAARVALADEGYDPCMVRGR
jgi:ATP-dependent Clp protease ATP-binding subunit ClpA